MDKVILSNGVEMPAIGYGTYKTPAGEACVEGVRKAIETGYRLVDTAAFYANEESVKEGIIDSRICNSDIFVQTKLWNSDQGYASALKAFEKSLKNLGADRIDAYLIHWPIAFDFRERWQSTIKDTWKAFERLYDEKAVRAIGVCNFQCRHLNYLLGECNVPPMIDQIEMHIGYPEKEVVDFCKKNGIAVEAWAPLARAKAFELKEVREVSESSGATPAQVLIKWCVQKGVVPLPKSVTPERIVENYHALDFILTAAEMAKLDNITEIGRLGSHPDDCKF